MILIVLFMMSSLIFLLAIFWLMSQLKKLKSQHKVQVQEIQELQEKLLHSARLATLGKMSGCLAHEINNPLTVIYGRIFQLINTLHEDEPDIQKAQMQVEKIEAAIQRVIKIIAGLKTLARDGSNDEMETVNLLKLIFETAELSQSRFTAHGIQLKLPPNSINPIYIRCRPVQISQVLENLLTNAVDALQNLPSPWIQIQVVDDSPHTIIKIIDSGTGISKNLQNQIFQPFFTTKSAKKGTGLGLSISKDIIEKHGGQFYLDPHHSHTCFVIELPKVISNTENKN